MNHIQPEHVPEHVQFQYKYPLWDHWVDVETIHSVQGVLYRIEPEQGEQ